MNKKRHSSSSSYLFLFQAAIKHKDKLRVDMDRRRHRVVMANRRQLKRVTEVEEDIIKARVGERAVTCTRNFSFAVIFELNAIDVCLLNTSWPHVFSFVELFPLESRWNNFAGGGYGGNGGPPGGGGYQPQQGGGGYGGGGGYRGGIIIFETVFRLSKYKSLLYFEAVVATTAVEVVAVDMVTGVVEAAEVDVSLQTCST